MSRIEQAISTYVQEISQQFRTGHAREHAYRPALARLMSSFEDTIAVNDPAHNKFGAPDFIFLSARNKNLVKGYAEAKDIDADLAKVEKTEQLRRYAGYDRLILTNYTEFRFYRSGEKYDEITIGAPHGTNLSLHPHDFGPLVSALDDFLRLPPEKIESGRRLAEIMGAKARRIRDHVRGLMNTDDAEGYAEVARIHRFMKENLVHDMGTDMFADMYAQTLVYGLFVARYNDKNLETFDRIEARSLIPSSIPFLQAFFDHLAGPHFDQRIGYIVDELCEVFRISDVRSVVWKYLKDSATHPEDVRDPIVHFYEDFLRNYDEEQRKRMGAYYTPTPVVKYIVRHVDRALKDHFGIPEVTSHAPC